MKRALLHFRKVARPLLACVVFGFVVNVLICWGLTLFADVTAGWHGRGQGPTDLDLRQFANQRGSLATSTDWTGDVLGCTGRIHASVWYQLRASRLNNLGPTEPRADIAGTAAGFGSAPIQISDGSASQVTLLIEAAGWPYLALKSELGAAALASDDPGVVPTQLPTRGGIAIDGQFKWFARHGLVSYPPGFSKYFTPTPSRHLPIWPIWDGLLANTAIFGACAALVLASARGLRGLLRSRAGRCPKCAHLVLGAQRCPECGHVF